MAAGGVLGLLRSGGVGSVVAGVAAGGALVLGLSPVSPTPARAAEAAVPFPVQSLGSLPALPSLAPLPRFAGGGGGVVGEPWTLVGLPGALAADDLGVSVDEAPVLTARGPVVRVTSLPGRGPYRFVVSDPGGDVGDASAVVWDSGVVSGSSDMCVVDASQVGCTIPVSGAGFVNGFAGLKVGGTYRLVVTDGVGTDSEQTFAPRLFSVELAEGVSGPVSVSVNSPVFNSGNGGFGLGLEFSTGRIGAVPGTASTDGLTPGLPPGWSISGVPGGHTRVSVVAAGGFQGFEALLRVASDSGVLYLGCEQAGQGLVCAGLDGAGASLSPSATVGADGSVRLTDASSSTVTSFDAKGRLTGVSRPFEPSVQVVYDAADRMDSVSWNHVRYDLFYAGESQCSDGVVPPGFVRTPAGSLCGWRASTEEGFSPGWLRVLYSQPEGGLPRVSRVMGLPDGCPADFGSCAVQGADVHDFGWDERNRPVAVRDPARSLAVLSGLVDAGDESLVTSYSYDDAGRMASVVQPAVTGGARSRMVAVYGPADARLAPATRAVTVTVDDTAGLVPAVSTVSAFDESARQVFTVSPTGEVSGSSFEAAADGKAVAAFTGGVLTADGVDWSRGTGMSYTRDAFDRVVSKSQSKASNFDPAACLPNGSARAYGACAPGDPDGRSVLTGTTEYDSGVGVPAGLIAHWFDSPDFSGNVAATVAVSQADSSAAVPGFPVEPPAGVGGRWSVRMTGSVVLDQPVVYGIEVSLPAGLADSGVLILDGSTICTVVTSTLQSCTYDNTEANPRASTSAPHMLRLDLSRDQKQPASGAVVVRLTAGSGAPVISNEVFRQRFSAVTTTTSSDLYPVSAGGQVGVWETTHAYQDVLAKGPSASSAPTAAGAVGLVSTFTTDTDDLGAPRPTSVLTPDGAARTTTYWGALETPTEAGVSYLDELPAWVRDLPQRGMPKTLTDAGARQVTTVYDPMGRAVCTQASGGNWECRTYDELGRVAQVVVHGGGEQPDVLAEYTYDFDTSRPELPMVESITRSHLSPGGGLGDTETDVVTTTTRTSLSGDITEYTDASGVVTTTTRDVAGRVISEQVRPSADTAPVRTRTATYLPNGLLASVGRDGATVATVRYDPTRAWIVTGYDYAIGAGVTADIADDDDPTTHQVTWTLADGTTIVDALSTTAGGRLLNQTFGATTYTYTYDANDRLSRASINGTDYTYGWNPDGLRTCAAEAVPNPGGASCETLPGAHTYTYTDQRLTTTTDPVAAPGGDPGAVFSYDTEGNLISTGQVRFTYSPTGKVTTMTSPESTTTYTHDPFERVLSETTTTPTGTTTTSYGYTSPTSGPATITTTAGTTIVDALPGGVIVQGGSYGILTGQGHLGQWLTPDGTADPQRPPTAYSPYGTNTPTTPNTPGWKGTTTTATGGFINLGPRTYLPALAMFAQPDPRPGGSGSGPYAYVAGDPINTHDLTGYNTQPWLTIGIGLLGMALTGFATYALSASIMTRLSGAYWATGWARAGAIALTLTADAVATAGIAVAQDAVLNNGHINLHDLTNTLTGSFLGAATAIAGIAGTTTGMRYAAKQTTRTANAATSELLNDTASAAASQTELRASASRSSVGNPSSALIVEEAAESGRLSRTVDNQLTAEETSTVFQSFVEVHGQTEPSRPLLPNKVLWDLETGYEGPAPYREVLPGWDDYAAMKGDLLQRIPHSGIIWEP